MGRSSAGQHLPCCFLIRSDLFTWPKRPELPAVIKIGNVGIGYRNNHVRLAVSVHIFESDGHDCQVLPVPVQGQALIEFGFCRIPCRKLNHFNVGAEVKRDKMAWTPFAVVIVADDGIGLEGAGSAIMPVVLRHIPPLYRYSSKYPQGEHCCHANAKDQRPMDTLSLPRGFCLFPACSLL